jgi:hypothetical protein
MYRYDPWGLPLSATGPLANLNQIRAKGYIFDPNVNWIGFAPNPSGSGDDRALNFVTHSFMQRDPAGEIQGGFNLTAAFGNDPLNDADSTGQSVEEYLPNAMYKYGRVNPTGKAFILNDPILDRNGLPRTRVPIVNNRPQLNAWSKGSVSIYITGDSRFDIAQATQMFQTKYPGVDLEDQTFHHNPLNVRKVSVNGIEIYVGEMQAVPRALNRAIPHVGSAAMARELQAAQGIDLSTYKLLAEGQNALSIKSQLSPAPRSSGSGTVLKALGIVGVYLTIRDAIEVSGIGGLQYDPLNAPYYYTDGLGSVFTVESSGMVFKDYTRRFIAGGRAGETESINEQDYKWYQQLAETKFGKYIQGTLLTKPRFVPGTERKTVPLLDEGANVIGWIDEDGPHENPKSLLQRYGNNPIYY